MIVGSRSVKKSRGFTWFWLAVNLFVSQGWAAESPVDIRQLMQLAEYIGVDYVEAVENGQIIDEDEYREMEEFSTLIVVNGELLLSSEGAQQFQSIASTLRSAIEDRADVEIIRDQTGELRNILLGMSPVLSLPEELIARPEISTMFQEQCAACHEESGNGNGLLSAQPNPAPTDFTGIERASNRSLVGLYDAISNLDPRQVGRRHSLRCLSDY